MRFLITAHPDRGEGESPAQPITEELLKAYFQYNEELHKAGVLLASEGLAPNARGAHVVASKGKRVAIDGPYAETKELIGGFYLIDVASREEAVAWALRCPVGLGFDNVLEIHQLTSEGDIPAEVLKVIREAAPTWSASFHKPR
jgi:hypothetical protein